MTRRVLLGIVTLLLGPIASASQTVMATFENFTAGQAFQPSFTDPLSGITFRNSTNPPPPGGFVTSAQSLAKLH